MKVAIFGLSITSSWGNGHATNYRGLARALGDRGDEVVFFERDQPWYARHRDPLDPSWGSTVIYDSVDWLRRHAAPTVRAAELVIVGSFVPEGAEVATWILSQAIGAVAFYDIDTPVTLERLRRGEADYLTPGLIERFDLYLSFTAGPLLQSLADEFGARRPEAFYCFVDPDRYRPVPAPPRWTLNYLGTYAAGRQPALEALLLDTARRRPTDRFALAGPLYPPTIRWPANLERLEHVGPAEHPGFYCAAQFTLNVTRPEMRAVGFSPSVRLFEAAACGVPVISDRWSGIETILTPGEEIFLADSTDEVLRILRENGPGRRRRVAAAARARVLAEHTASRRAERLHELVGAGVPAVDRGSEREAVR